MNWEIPTKSPNTDMNCGGCFGCSSKHKKRDDAQQPSRGIDGEDFVQEFSSQVITIGCVIGFVCCTISIASSFHEYMVHKWISSWILNMIYIKSIVVIGVIKGVLSVSIITYLRVYKHYVIHFGWHRRHRHSHVCYNISTLILDASQV